jgi:hypothetical protein
LRAAGIHREAIMDDDDHRQLTPARSSLPVRVTPRPTIPTLQSSSGAFPWTRTYVARKDAEFLETDTRRILAQKAQTEAFTGLVESRMTAALVMAKIQALPELAHHQYDRGRSERQAEKSKWQHAARVVALEHEREQTNALADLVRAQQRLAELQPAPPPPPAPAPPAPPPAAPMKGLTTAEVQMIAQRLPELKPETVETLCMMLSGLLAEKNS